MASLILFGKMEFTAFPEIIVASIQVLKHSRSVDNQLPLENVNSLSGLYPRSDISLSQSLGSSILMVE